MLPERNILLKANDAELEKFCTITFSKGSGPGGQKRNKTSTAVTVSLPEYNLSAGDCTERSQFRNRVNALHKLRMMLALSVRQLPAETPPRPDCSMSASDYPLFAALLLDVLQECSYDHKAAAEKCDISASSLLKKLYRDPLLWQHVRKMRQANGLPPFNAPK